MLAWCSPVWCVVRVPCVARTDCRLLSCSHLLTAGRKESEAAASFVSALSVNIVSDLPSLSLSLSLSLSHLTGRMLPATLLSCRHSPALTGKSQYEIGNANIPVKYSQAATAPMILYYEQMFIIRQK